MSYRRGYRTIEVQCTGEVFVDEFETEILIAELKRRDHEYTTMENAELRAIYDALKEHRYSDATIALERFIWPKFSSVEQAKEKLLKAK